MRKTSGLIGAIICLSASLCAMAQAGSSTRKIILPNPQLIRCHSAACSQLWKQDSDHGDPVYPAQVLTDLVNGEVVGLTAVYDKSVSIEEIRAAVNRLYGKRPPSFHSDSMSTWRIEEEQFAISIFDGADGAKELTYLKFVTYSSGMKPGTYPSLVPGAHIYDCKK